MAAVKCLECTKIYDSRAAACPVCGKENVARPTQEKPAARGGGVNYRPIACDTDKCGENGTFTDGDGKRRCEKHYLQWIHDDRMSRNNTAVPTFAKHKVKREGLL